MRAEYVMRQEGEEQVSVLALNGDEIFLREDPQTRFDEILTLHKKTDRAGLDKKDRLALITAATEKQEATFFTALSLTIDDEGKLADCYNINKKIEKVEARHRMYDMHDVFNIVVPEENGKTLKGEVYNLYHDYASISLEMVAASNKWYNQWPEGPTWRENLTWTHQFFENNVSAELAEKINEEYLVHPKEERGGPLYFAILINQILSQTEEATLALQLRLKRLEIRNVPGENIDKVVSLARAAIMRLETFGKVPEDLIRILLKIFQTSSIDSFNQIFQHMEKQRYLDQALATNGYAEKLSKEGIFKVATNQYRLQWEEGTWNGTQVKGNQAIFTAGKSLCWNCGSDGHTLGDCKVPRDQARISANKKSQKKFLKKSKGKDAETKVNNGGAKNEPKAEGKWKPPTSEERNRRVIDGKPMFYNRRLKKWVLDRDANPAGNVAATSDSASVRSSGTATTASTTTTMGSANTARAARVEAYANAFATALDKFAVA